MDALLLLAVEPLHFPLGSSHDNVRSGNAETGNSLTESLQALSEEEGNAGQAGAVKKRAARPGHGQHPAHARPKEQRPVAVPGVTAELLPF